MEMRRYLVIILVLLSATAFGQGGGMAHYPGAGSVVTAVVMNGFTHKYSLTINHLKCGSGNSTNFPVLVSCTNVQLKTTGNGGSVTNSSGYDINFYSDNGLTTLLNWEVESYVATTGQLIAWVLIPTVSSSSDITFYMMAGKSSITTFQGGTAGIVWNSGFKKVHHMGTTSTASGADVTTNVSNMTINGTVTGTTGKIYGASSFNGTNANYMSSSYQLPTTNFTYSFWAQSTVSSLDNRPVCNSTYQTGQYGTSIIWGYSLAGQLYAIFRSGANVTTNDLNATATGLNSGWHHVAVVEDNANGATVYYDGAALVSGASQKSITLSTYTFSIGRESDQSSAAFNGQVDEVRVSNVVRDANWIKTEFNSTSGPGDFGAANFLTYATIL